MADTYPTEPLPCGKIVTQRNNSVNCKTAIQKKLLHDVRWLQLAGLMSPAEIALYAGIRRQERVIEVMISNF